MLDELPDATEPWHDGGRTARHRFQCGASKSLVHRQIEEHIGRPEELGDLGTRQDAAMVPEDRVVAGEPLELPLRAAECGDLHARSECAAHGFERGDGGGRLPSRRPRPDHRRDPQARRARSQAALAVQLLVDARLDLRHLDGVARGDDVAQPVRLGEEQAIRDQRVARERLADVRRVRRGEERLVVLDVVGRDEVVAAFAQLGYKAGGLEMGGGDDVRAGGDRRKLVDVAIWPEQLLDIVVGAASALHRRRVEGDRGVESERAQPRDLLIDGMRATGAAGAEPGQHEHDPQRLAARGVEC